MLLENPNLVTTDYLSLAGRLRVILFYYPQCVREVNYGPYNICKALYSHCKDSTPCI
jgi:hypothetical protein